MTDKTTLLTSSEIASLWTSYMQNSMSIQVMSYFLKTVEDSEVRAIIEKGQTIATTHMAQLLEVFQKEEIPTPAGFSESDVNLNAPRLYTDSFMMTYLNHMSKTGMLGYSGFLAMSARKDIRKIFKEALYMTSDFYDESSEVLLEKGLYVRSPYINYPKQKDFIDSKKYLSGLNPFSNKRPLNAIELSYLHMNIQTSLMGTKLSAVLPRPRQEKKFRN